MSKKAIAILEGGQSAVILANQLCTGILLTETGGGRPMLIVNLEGGRKIFAFEGDASFEQLSNVRGGDLITGVAGDMNSSFNKRTTPSGDEISEKQTIFTQFQFYSVIEGTFGAEVEGASAAFAQRKPITPHVKKGEAGGRKDAFEEQGAKGEATESAKAPSAADKL